MTSSSKRPPRKLSRISREGRMLVDLLVVVIMHTIVRVTDFLADLAVTLQSAALGLRSGFAARFAFLSRLLLVLRELAESR